MLSAQNALLLTTYAGGIVHMNNTWNDVYGFTLTEIEGHRPQDILSETKSEYLVNSTAYSKAQNGDASEYITRHYR
jgi:PAS domain-containing protein